MLNMRIFADILSARACVYMNNDTGYRMQGAESKDYAAFLICALAFIDCAAK